MVLDFRPALSGIGKKIRELVLILHASHDIKRIFVEAPLVSFRRHKNLKGELVRRKIQRSVLEGLKRCGKSSCLICKFVKEGRSFHNNLGNRKLFANNDFDCDSKGIVYLIKCKKCSKHALEAQSRRLECVLTIIKVAK